MGDYIISYHVLPILCFDLASAPCCLSPNDSLDHARSGLLIEKNLMRLALE